MSESKRTFPPTIREDGRVLAGGLTLFEVTADGRLAFEDRFRRRCQERGTPDVEVDLSDLLDQLLYHFALKDRT